MARLIPTLRSGMDSTAFAGMTAQVGCGVEFLFRIMEVDHVVPRSRGGSDHPDNLQLLCPNCNRVKGDRDMAYLVARLGEG